MRELTTIGVVLLILTIGMPALPVTAQDTLHIHPIGNSITRGKDGDVYRPYLKNLVENELGVMVDFVGTCPHGPGFKAAWSSFPNLRDRLDGDVEHDGWGALRIDEIINSQQAYGYPQFTIEDLLAAAPSDYILLMVGTNDVLQDYQLDTAPARLDSLVGRIVTNSEARLLLASIPPLTSSPSDAEQVIAFNEEVPGIAARYRQLGHPVEFVDVHAVMEESDLLSDGIHPNEEGNQAIADAWFAGVAIVLSGEKEPRDVPQHTVLEQNYPNPFNPATTIPFELDAPAQVRLSVYNLLGIRVAEVANRHFDRGSHTLNWSARDLPSGVYVYRLEASGSIAERMMVLSR